MSVHESLPGSNEAGGLDDRRTKRKIVLSSCGNVATRHGKTHGRSYGTSWYILLSLPPPPARTARTGRPSAAEAALGGVEAVGRNEVETKGNCAAVGGVEAVRRNEVEIKGNCVRVP